MNLNRLAVGIFSFYLFCFCHPNARADNHEWLHAARIGGLGLTETMSETDINRLLDNLIREGVNVVEADSCLSDYLDEESFEMELEFMKKVVTLAHKKELKIVWYYPTLEVITPEGRIATTSMQRDHPDWVQMNFDRNTYNYFYGTKAFWIEPNDESAWMCPLSPYRDYFYSRIRRLSRIGLDGLWLDVPLLSAIVGSWPCACPRCIAVFEKDTGLPFPKEINFSDRSFKRWILWRHQILADFLKDCLHTARQSDPNIRVIIEVVSMDHMINTTEGLDVTYFDPELDIVWELDCLSDTTGMRDASVDDWFNLFLEYKYARGISKNKSRWAFSYGYREPDAQLVMASAIAAQTNPYETRIPMMVKTTGRLFRTKMYQWLKINSDFIYRSQSNAQVALLYSPPTRDFIDGHVHGGMFITTYPAFPAIEWWTHFPDWSLLNTNYLIEYRGWGMLLIRNHIPFDILSINQLEADDFARYDVLILPGAVNLSSGRYEQLLSYVKRGGTLVVTGKDSGTMDEYGEKRKASLWDTMRREKSASPPPGKGVVVFIDEKLGAAYLHGEKKNAITASGDILRNHGVASLVKEDPPVYIQTYKEGKKLIIHVVHYGWTEKAREKPFSREVTVSIPWLIKDDVKKIIHTSPDLKLTEEIKYRKEGQNIIFQITTLIQSLVVIEY